MNITKDGCSTCGFNAIRECPDCGRDWGHGCCGICGGTQRIGYPHDHKDCKIIVMTKALEKISKASKFVNGMVIDPCPTVMCYASQTIDVATEALANARDA